MVEGRVLYSGGKVRTIPVKPLMERVERAQEEIARRVGRFRS
jgi:hypothetical protein